MSTEKRGGLINSLSWKFAERISAQIVTTIVSIILARVIDPEHYGVISIVSIFITLANTFVSDGLGSALIQKKDADALDFSSVLYFNIGLSLVLYAILYLCAPLVTDFYGKGYEVLTPVLRVLGLRIIIASVNSIQNAYVSKKMMFKKFFMSTFSATVVSAVVGIYMAYAGYGVWALVGQYLSNSIIATIAMMITLKKVPLLRFSFVRVKKLIAFGSKVLSTSLLITLFNDLRSLLIGKLYTASDLAFFDKGKQFPGLIVNNINSSIGAVLFPKMANEQNDVQSIKHTARMSVRFSSYFMCPIMLGFAAVAKPFVLVFLTDKWLDVVPLLQVFCIFYLFQPIHSANMQAIKAVGRGDIYLRNEIIKKAIELFTLLICINISVEAIAVNMAVCATAFVFVNAYPNAKLIHYSIKEQMNDILPPVAMAGTMSIVVYALSLLNLPPLILMCCQIGLGGVIYLGLSAVTHNKEFLFVLSLIRQRFMQNKGE